MLIEEEAKEDKEVNITITLRKKGISFIHMLTRRPQENSVPRQFVVHRLEAHVFPFTAVLTWHCLFSPTVRAQSLTQRFITIQSFNVKLVS